ncbi:GSCOCG00002255001-RA-CDS [Cotesia congregata]|nr:GSCOCG00002255001-RA-CDS [Cotesia congregata]
MLLRILLSDPFSFVELSEFEARAFNCPPRSSAVSTESHLRVNVNRIVSSWIGKKKSSSNNVLPLYSCKNSVTWHKMFHSRPRRHTWMYCLNDFEAFAADLLAQQLSIS